MMSNLPPGCTPSKVAADALGRTYRAIGEAIASGALPEPAFNELREMAGRVDRIQQAVLDAREEE